MADVTQYEGALRLQREHLGESHPDALRSLYGLVMARWWNGDLAQAGPLTRQGLEISRRAAPASELRGTPTAPSQPVPALNTPRRITESLERLVQLYDAWAKPAQAAEWKQKLAAFQQANKTAEKKEAQP